MQGWGSESAASPDNKVNGIPWNWVMRGVLSGGQLAPTTFSFCASPQPSSQTLDSETQAVEPEEWGEGMLADGNKG